MTIWILKQLAQTMARYAIAQAVVLVAGSAGQFLIFDAVSGS